MAEVRYDWTKQHDATQQQTAAVGARHTQRSNVHTQHIQHHTPPHTPSHLISTVHHITSTHRLHTASNESGGDKTVLGDYLFVNPIHDCSCFAIIPRQPYSAPQLANSSLT